MPKTDRRWLALAREALIRANIDPMRVDDIIEDQFETRIGENLKEWAFQISGNLEAKYSELEPVARGCL